MEKTEVRGVEIEKHTYHHQTVYVSTVTDRNRSMERQLLTGLVGVEVQGLVAERVLERCVFLSRLFPRSPPPQTLGEPLLFGPPLQL
eukprot:5525225-Amphidinium_carterae.1